MLSQAEKRRFHTVPDAAAFSTLELQHVNRRLRECGLAAWDPNMEQDAHKKHEIVLTRADAQELTDATADPSQRSLWRSKRVTSGIDQVVGCALLGLAEHSDILGCEFCSSRFPLTSHGAQTRPACAGRPACARRENCLGAVLLARIPAMSNSQPGIMVWL